MQRINSNVTWNKIEDCYKMTSFSLLGDIKPRVIQMKCLMIIAIVSASGCFFGCNRNISKEIVTVEKLDLISRIDGTLLISVYLDYKGINYSNMGIRYKFLKSNVRFELNGYEAAEKGLAYYHYAVQKAMDGEPSNWGITYEFKENENGNYSYVIQTSPSEAGNPSGDSYEINFRVKNTDYYGQLICQTKDKNGIFIVLEECIKKGIIQDGIQLAKDKLDASIAKDLNDSLHIH